MKIFLFQINQLLLFGFVFCAVQIAALDSIEPGPSVPSLDSILLSRNKSSLERSKSFRQLRFCVPKIRQIQSYPIRFVTPPIYKNESLRFNPSNPSIKKTKDGYICIVRLIPYQFGRRGGRDVFWIDPSCPAKLNKNTIVKLGKDFRIKKIKPMEDFLENDYNGTPHGFFDIRLIHSSSDGSSLKILASSHELNKLRNSQMVYGELREESHSYKLSKCTPIMGPDAFRHEKNWMPFEKKGKLYAYYSYDPLTICSINRNSGEISLKKHPLIPYDFSHFSGSAPPIHLDGGSLILVHEKGVCNNQNYWLYLQRFLWISKTGLIQKISYPFVFQQKGVEFCCGMTFDHAKKNIVFSYGIEDEQAFISTVPISIVRSMLHSI